MSILCTVTTNLQVKNANGYAGIQKHTQHDPKLNHSNKDINFNETCFNVYNEGPKARKAVADWNNDKFGDFVRMHDEHQRETDHSERCYKSVQGYLKDRKKATGVLTIGNMDVQAQLIEQFCPKDSYDVEVLADGSKHAQFKLYDNDNKPIEANINVAKQFYGCFNRALNTATNNSVGWHLKNGGRINVSDYLFRGRWATNNDEMGMSHIHYEIATFGMTRGGKKRKSHATSSLNQALVSLHKAVKGTNCSGREAIRWYRSEVDKYALRCLEDELHKTYHVPKKVKILEFERKTSSDPGTQTGLTMTQLKSQKQELARHQQALNKLQSKADELSIQNNNAQKRIEQVQQLNDVAKTVMNDVQDTYKTLSGGKSLDNATSPLDVAKAVKSASDDVKQEVNDNKQRIQRQKQRITQQQQQLDAQQRQLRDMQQQQKALKKENEQLKKDNNALKEAIETFKQRAKNAGLIIGTWFKNHWKQVEEPLKKYAHNINNAEHERIYGGRDGTGDVYEARRFEKEAKNGLLSSLKGIELKTAKDMGLQESFSQNNNQAENDDELTK